MQTYVHSLAETHADRRGLRERKKARLRQQIMLTAVEFFRTRGYAATRVADIVQALEISQPTFFRYYPSKDAVLKDALALIFGNLSTRLVETQEEGLSVEETLKIGYGQLAELVEKEKALTRAIGVSGAAIPWFGGERLGVLRDLITSTLEYGQERGEIREELDLAQASRMFIGMVGHMVFTWASLDEPKYSLREELHSAIELFCRGATPRN